MGTLNQIGCHDCVHFVILFLHHGAQQLIFEKFYRIFPTDLEKHKGFGLGLSYVKKIVELHGGEIKLQSERNRGTRF
ncbi:MAG: ATP-binding protein, partial [Bacteroidota bacterium]